MANKTALWSKNTPLSRGNLEGDFDTSQHQIALLEEGWQEEADFFQVAKSKWAEKYHLWIF